MQKHISFVITAAVLLAASFTSVSLYAIHIANAQTNMTSAGGANNMTKGSNTTGATGNTTLSSIHTGKPASLCPAENQALC
jgi:hypothetical protein